MASSGKYEGRKSVSQSAIFKGQATARKNWDKGAEMGGVPGRRPCGLPWLLLASLDRTPSEKVDEVFY